MTKLSICIPTYNRSKYLENCLKSIITAKKESRLKIEVCISDNNSEENLSPILNKYKKKIKIIINKNKKNIGVARNILKSVSMAKGDFVWILGNDDLVVPSAFKYLFKLFKEKSKVEFFYINSFNIEHTYIQKNKLPLDTKKINFQNFERFSNYKISGDKNFFELINPFISFEFLLSMNLCVFRRKNWNRNLGAINKKNIKNKRVYSNFDNTAPHVKIWSKAFRNKKSYFLSKPLSANIHGPRGADWGSYYPLVEGIRIPEALECYRKNGMTFLRYYFCKNYALRRFLPAMYKMFFKKNYAGSEYVGIWKHIIKNLLYPSIYFFGLYFLIKRILKFKK